MKEVWWWVRVFWRPILALFLVRWVYLLPSDHHGFFFTMGLLLVAVACGLIFSHVGSIQFKLRFRVGGIEFISTQEEDLCSRCSHKRWLYGAELLGQYVECCGRPSCVYESIDTLVAKANTALNSRKILLRS